MVWLYLVLNLDRQNLYEKKLCKIFQEYGLRINSTANVKNVNFLDNNMDIQRGIHKPYMKPNDQPIVTA